MHENGIVLINVDYKGLKKNSVTQLAVEERDYKVILDVDNAFEEDTIRIFTDSDLGVRLLNSDGTQVKPFYEMLDLRHGALGFNGAIGLEWEIINGHYDNMGLGGELTEERTESVLNKATYADVKMRSFHFTNGDDLVVVNVNYV